MRFIELAKQSEYDLSKLHALYAQLSRDIHGAPWSGPAVRGRVEQLGDVSEQRFLRGLISDMGLELES